MFAYQTLALRVPRPHPAGCLAAHRIAAVPQRAGWLTIAVVGIFATVVTHHVTSYVLVAAPDA